MNINRQAAIEAVSKACQEWRGIFGRCEDALKALPSAVPERKKGKNICDSVTGRHCEFKCSVCGVEISVVEGGDLDGAYGFKFCPGCGAEIEES